MKHMSTYYFAYGSNLNATDFHGWCAQSGFDPANLRPVKTALLPDHELRFSHFSNVRNGGVLNLAQKHGSIVQGVVFEVCSEDTWKALDTKEGAPIVYERVPVIVIDDAGQSISAQTYRVPLQKAQAHIPPNEDYLSIVKSGYERYGFDTGSLLDSAAGKSGSCELDSFFVYGTLMRGESRSALLPQFNITCALGAVCPGSLFEGPGYPRMSIDGIGDSRVHGEFVRVGDVEAAIRELDKVEGFMGFLSRFSLFRRTIVYCDVGSGRFRRAWAYISRVDNPEACEKIPSGDWRRFQDKHEATIKKIVSKYVYRSRGKNDLIAYPRKTVEQSILMEIVRQVPFSFNPDASKKMIQETLFKLIVDGAIDERLVAQACDDWAVWFEA